MSFLRASSTAFFFSLFMLFPILPTQAHAQTSAGTDACSDSTGYLSGETTAARQARLTADSAACAIEVAAAQSQLQSAQDQSASLQKDINVLTAQINAAQLKIKQENLIIQTLGQNIIQKQSNINSLQAQIDRDHQTLAQILAKMNEAGDVSIPEIILGSDSLSQAMAGFDDFQSIQQALAVTFAQLRADEAQNQSEKVQLTDQQSKEEDAKAVIQQQQATVQQAQNQKKQLLSISKGNESAYNQLVAQRQAKAAQIRAALFNLAGGGQAIPFGQALQYAQEASKITGIRPAFLLAVITQESALGANVGSCLVTDLNTGNGVGKNSGSLYEQVMKAPRDTMPFLNITKSLGMDWATTPVSCPIADKAHNYDATKYYLGRGYGGAMGPAQFIPSTWDNGTATSFKNRVAQALSITLPNPWNPEDAFLASAFYLTDLGAVNGSYTGEVRAACSYFGTGGSSCSYGQQVRTKANTIQTTQIDPLNGV